MSNIKIINFFKKNKYVIVNKILSEEMSDFLYKYLLLKRQVASTLFKSNYIDKNLEDFGHWKDPQVMNTFSIYGDVAMETLLIKLMPVMKEITNLNLNPNYAFARVYKKHDILHKHKDRESCEISTTLNLGGDSWPIFLKIKKQKIKVLLNPGDMLVYRGCELEHWREEFKGENCGQVFLHYNSILTTKNIFDDRPHLGLPCWFRKKIII